MSDAAATGSQVQPVAGSASIKRDIATKISIIARCTRNLFDRQVANLGVTRSQWMMIAIVATHPGSNQRAIAEELEMSEASAGRLIDRLCNEGLIERRACKDDKRARAVYLADETRPLLENLARLASITEERLFNGFSEAELAQMQNFVDRLHANAGKG